MDEKLFQEFKKLFMNRMEALARQANGDPRIYIDTAIVSFSSAEAQVREAAASAETERMENPDLPEKDMEHA